MANTGIIEAAESASSNARPKRRPMVAKVRRLNAAHSIAVALDDDVAGWRSRLKELLATSSPLFVEASPKQLMAAAKLPGESATSTTGLSAALELISSLEPENESQADRVLHEI